MICRLCDEDHAGHCSRAVKALRAKLNEVTSLLESNGAAIVRLQESNCKFDKRTYQREYMRKRRAG